MSADLIARGVLAGHVQHGTYVAPVGAASWAPLETIPEVTAAIDAARSLEEAKSAVPLPFGPPVPIVSPLAAPPPAAPAAPASLAPPAAAGMTQVISAIPEPAKEEPKKPAINPQAKLLPLMIFAGFVGVSIVETLLVVILRR